MTLRIHAHCNINAANNNLNTSAWSIFYGNVNSYKNFQAEFQSCTHRQVELFIHRFTSIDGTYIWNEAGSTCNWKQIYDIYIYIQLFCSLKIRSERLFYLKIFRAKEFLKMEKVVNSNFSLKFYIFLSIYISV